MEILKKIFVFVSSANTEAFKNAYVGENKPTTYHDKLVFLDGTQEIFTKGKLYGLNQAAEVSALREYIGELSSTDTSTVIGYLKDYADKIRQEVAENATASRDGLMSKEDKAKLDKIADEANNYSLPVASSTVLGGIKSGGDITIDANGVVSVNDDSHNHTVANIDNLQSYLDAKQATISDLATIRSGAALGATALQSVPEATTSKSGLLSYVDKSKIDSIEAGAQVNTITGVKGNSETTYRTGNVNITKANIGLGNVDNTSDANKPISTATQNALDDKVDKVTGKGLSTNDFTTALLNKLNSLENYDDAELSGAIQSLQTQMNTLLSGDAEDKIESFNEILSFLDGVKDTESLKDIIASIEQQITSKQDKISDLATIRSGAAAGATALQSVPVATSSSLGGIKSGGDITIDGNGVVSVKDDSHNHTVANIDNLQTYLDAKQATISDLATIRSGAALGATALQSVPEATTSKSGLLSYVDKSKIDSIEAGAQVNTITGVKGNSETTYRTGNVNITKANIGLGNVDNTSDANKPISTATQNALDGKQATISDLATIRSGAAAGATALQSVPVASSTVLGGIKSGGDITINSSGVVSVNDDSHNHTVANVDNLQTYLDAKAPKSHTHNVSDINNLQSYLDSKTSNTGTVTSVVAGTGLNGGTITTSGTISLAESGATAGTYGPTANVDGTTGTEVSIDVPKITVDAYGRITSVSTYSMKTKNTTYSSMSASEATTGTGTTAKLISPKVLNDKIKEVVDAKSIPVASSTVLGGIKSGGDITINSSGVVSVNDDSHNHTVANVDNLQTYLDAKAPLASPTFTGTPKAPTAAAGTSSTQLATTAFVTTAISNKIKRYTNVAASNWADDSTYEDYPYCCSVSCSGVVATDFAEVVYGLNEADSGDYAPICETASGIVKIWSKSSAAITIPLIVVTKQ